MARLPRVVRLLPHAVLLAMVLVGSPGCRGKGSGNPDLGEVPARPLPTLYAADHPFDAPGDAAGRADITGLTVFGFSHGTPVQQDPQVYEKLRPDIVMRGWHAGWMDNQPVAQFTVGYKDRCQAAGIVFMGGLTGSAIFPEDRPPSPSKGAGGWCTSSITTTTRASSPALA